MDFGLCGYAHACRPRPASLPIRVPTVGVLPATSFSHGLAAAALSFSYGYFHQFRLVRFIQLVEAHAGHTRCGVSPQRGERRSKQARGEKRLSRKTSPSMGSFNCRQGVRVIVVAQPSSNVESFVPQEGNECIPYEANLAS